jgi:hypothetical protein
MKKLLLILCVLFIPGLISAQNHPQIYGGGATINDAAGNGDTTVIWSADKSYDEFVLKLNAANSPMTGDATLTDATPTFILNDSDNAAGTAGSYANSSGGANDIIWSFGVEDSTGASTEYFQIDGVTETIDFLKPVTLASGWSITGTTSGGQYMFLREDTDNTADNYSGWGIYGELAHDTIYALPLAAPAAGQVMSFAAPGNQTMSDGSTQSVSVGTNVYKDQSQDPVIDDADNFDDNCTGQCLRGGTFIVNAAGTIVLPEATSGMNFTVILEGANATIIDPLGTGTADAIHMNGLAAADDENITSSTRGAMCVFQYRSANHWTATCNGFAEATPP